MFGVSFFLNLMEVMRITNYSWSLLSSFSNWCFFVLLFEFDLFTMSVCRVSYLCVCFPILLALITLASLFWFFSLWKCCINKKTVNVLNKVKFSLENYNVKIILRQYLFSRQFVCLWWFWWNSGDSKNTKSNSVSNNG